MLREDVKTVFIEILQNHIELIDNKKLNLLNDENTEIKNLEFDSLDIMEILVEIEETFGIRVPDDWIIKNDNMTIGKMINFLFLNKQE